MVCGNEIEVQSSQETAQCKSCGVIVQGIPKSVFEKEAEQDSAESSSEVKLELKHETALTMVKHENALQLKKNDKNKERDKSEQKGKNKKIADSISCYSNIDNWHSGRVNSVLHSYVAVFAG